MIKVANCRQTFSYVQKKCKKKKTIQQIYYANKIERRSNGFATYTCGTRLYALRTCRRGWNSSLVGRVYDDRGLGRVCHRNRNGMERWWRQLGSQPCPSSYSTIASGRELDGSSGRRCTRRAVEETFPSSKARTQPAPILNPSDNVSILLNIATKLQSTRYNTATFNDKINITRKHLS